MNKWIYIVIGKNITEIHVCSAGSGLFNKVNIAFVL
jgi:hypothetical protein